MNMRTTVDISDEAYQAVKAFACDRKESMGQVMSQLILKGVHGPADQIGKIVMKRGVPVVSYGRVVTTEEVREFLAESE